MSQVKRERNGKFYLAVFNSKNAFFYFCKTIITRIIYSLSFTLMTAK